MAKDDLFKFLVLQALDLILKLLVDISTRRTEREGCDYRKGIHTWGKEVDKFYEEHLPNDP